MVIAHGPTGILAEASERRSQADNRQQAIFRLRLNLSVGYRAACDPREPASPLWIARRRDRRIVVSAKHQDYPALLAELLDFLQATDFELAAASEHFEVTASQLVRLLRSHPPALALVNARRATVGAGRLT